MLSTGQVQTGAEAGWYTQSPAVLGNKASDTPTSSRNRGVRQVDEIHFALSLEPMSASTLSLYDNPPYTPGRD